MPIGSNGAMGTVVSSGETLFIATTGSTEPWLPPFETILEKHDTDKDGRVSAKEFTANKDWAEHFGFFDHDADNFISSKEWATMRSYGAGEFGAMAIRPGNASGKLDAKAVLWRFKRTCRTFRRRCCIRTCSTWSRTAGSSPRSMPRPASCFHEVRSPKAMGEYHASPVAADGKVFLANTEGKVTVLKAGPEGQVLAVNEMGEEVHATPALVGGRIYLRTRSAVYSFASK